jgi:enoyl-CoA hydratase/carnithine racemase
MSTAHEDHTLGFDPDELSTVGLKVTWQEPVLRLTLAAPDRRNAQSPQLWSVLARVGDWVRGRGRGVQIIVIDAEGLSFSAGLDRRMFTPEGIPGQTSLMDVVRADDADKLTFIEAAQAGFRWLRDVPAVSIAVVSGHAIGAGFQLALAADVVVPHHDAVFAMKETSWGLVPDLGGSLPMVRGAGYGPALIACATGQDITAAQLASWGLAVTPVDDPAAESARIIDALLATPPGAVADLKDLLTGIGQRRRSDQWQREAQVQSRRLNAWAEQLPS